MQRYDFVDIAKVIGIFLVVLGHYVFYLNLMPYTFNSIWIIELCITLFHMPLFFIISGMLYKPCNIATTWHKCIQQLLKPYVYISLICILFGSVFAAFHGAFEWKTIAKSIIGIFTGSDFFGYGIAPYSGPLWFCFSLVMIKLFMSYIYSLKNKLYMLIIIVLGGGMMMYIGEKLPFRIDSSLVGFIFFYIGYCFKHNFLSFSQMASVKLWTILLGSAIILYIVAFTCIDFELGKAFSINAMRFGKHPIAFFLSGVAGSLFIFSISQLLAKYTFSWMRVISNGTIIILGFHHLIMLQFRGIIVSYNPLVAVVFSFFVIFICYGIIKLCEKHFPILLGNRLISKSSRNAK